jgi:dephospho-CoA kinase
VAGLIVALTGGIASGKSEVGRRFESLGVPLLDADRIARDLVDRGMPAFDEILQRFGTAIVQENGDIDRARLRQLVFADDVARRALEAILHPRIRAELHRLCIAATAAYAIAAIPLLAEGGGRTAYPWLDRILVVDLPRELQRERLLRRDGITPDLAERMLAAQVDRAQRLLIADDVIDNSGAPSALDTQVEVLHRKYIELAKSRHGER